MNKYVLDSNDGRTETVNIVHKTREAISRTVDDGLDDFTAFYGTQKINCCKLTKIFFVADAQEEIFQLMLTDSFPRFKRQALSQNADATVRSRHRMHSIILLVSVCNNRVAT